MQRKLYTPNKNNKSIIEQINILTDILRNELNIDVQQSPNLSKNNVTTKTHDDNASTSTTRDADNDVVMKNRYSNNLQQVP